jgi:hypothetical protein
MVGWGDDTKQGWGSGTIFEDFKLAAPVVR